MKAIRRDARSLTKTRYLNAAENSSTLGERKNENSLKKKRTLVLDFRAIGVMCHKFKAVIVFGRDTVMVCKF